MSTKVTSDSFDVRAVALRVLAENGFEADSKAAHAEAEKLSEDVTPTKGVRDMRDVAWSSIDNEQSRDLDQIEAIQETAGGGTKIFVGIADVDALVRMGTALDKHAALNTTSLYTGTDIFPMLPERLSTCLTSLLPERDRYAMVTEVLVDGDGNVTGGDVYPAVVRNHAKLAYEHVAAWFAGREKLSIPGAIEDQLRAQDRMAQRLRAHRKEHGALDLQTAEATVVAKDGEVVDLRLVEESRSRQLIEEFMIAANGVVARWLVSKHRAGLRRIVRTPKRWDRIVELAATFGTKLPAEPNSLALSAFLNDRRAKDPAHYADVSLAVVKLMGPGEYVVEKPGENQEHFGLAVHDYTHATAPNRRFVDLVTQRILKAPENGTAVAPYSHDDLAHIGAHCTEREHAAQKVERTMRKVGAALFMQKRIGETFDGIITGVTSSGTFVRLVTPPAEGRIVRGEQGVDVGDKVRVRLVATEPSRGFIDFARA
ncbi:MAG TPA: RNB domain-containing ribonuclease [Polyangiaceae bacterium]|jgi:exoribonuclease-2